MTPTLAALDLDRPDDPAAALVAECLRSMADALDAPSSGLGRAIVRDLHALADELDAAGEGGGRYPTGPSSTPQDPALWSCV